MNIKFRYLTLIIILQSFKSYFCDFEETEYIKEINSIKNLNIELGNNENKPGIVLLYSIKNDVSFSNIFIKLSETFHDQMFFFAISEQSDYSKKFKKITNFPTIFFYDKKKFTEYKGNLTFESISNLINTYYIKHCKKISNKDFEHIYKNEYLSKEYIRNLIMFNLNKEDEFFDESLKLFESLTNYYLISYIDLCYYTDDSENDIKNVVKSFSKQKGNHSFKLKDFNENNKDLHKQYEIFLSNKVVNSYEIINTKKRKKIIDLISDKMSVFFVYANIKQKNEFITLAEKFYRKSLNSNKNVQKNNYFNYVVINKNIHYDKFSKMDGGHIYLSKKKIKKIYLIDNVFFIEKLIDEINKNNQKEFKIVLKYIQDNFEIIYEDENSDHDDSEEYFINTVTKYFFKEIAIVLFAISSGICLFVRFLQNMYSKKKKSPGVSITYFIYSNEIEAIKIAKYNLIS